MDKSLSFSSEPSALFCDSAMELRHSGSMQSVHKPLKAAQPSFPVTLESLQVDKKLTDRASLKLQVCTTYSSPAMLAKHLPRTVGQRLGVLAAEVEMVNWCCEHLKHYVQEDKQRELTEISRCVEFSTGLGFIGIAKCYVVCRIINTRHAQII